MDERSLSPLLFSVAASATKALAALKKNSKTRFVTLRFHIKESFSLFCLCFIDLQNFFILHYFFDDKCRRNFERHILTFPLERNRAKKWTREFFLLILARQAVQVSKPCWKLNSTILKTSRSESSKKHLSVTTRKISTSLYKNV